MTNSQVEVEGIAPMCGTRPGCSTRKCASTVLGTAGSSKRPASSVEVPMSTPLARSSTCVKRVRSVLSKPILTRAPESGRPCSSWTTPPSSTRGATTSTPEPSWVFPGSSTGVQRGSSIRSRTPEGSAGRAPTSSA